MSFIQDEKRMAIQLKIKFDCTSIYGLIKIFI